MSFDFFGQGIKEETPIRFTKQQEMFFQSKLPFLDPDGKKSIPLGQAISLLKFSGLPPNMQKKILTNLKVTGKGTLDYMDMKKILRGVALAQNRIQPSTININANIKTKMPVFHDDDSDEQEEEKQQKKIPQKQGHRPQQKTWNQPQKQPQVSNPPKPNPAPQQAPPRPSIQNKPMPQTQKNEAKQSEDNLSNSLKKFDQYWSTLSTEGGEKISGNQVKKLFGKSQNRKQLSKIWKICNITLKGYLTKGQLYVFVQLMKIKSGSIPSSLTGQMKEIIHKIDSMNGYKKNSQTAIGHSQLGFSNFDIDKSQNLEKSHHREKNEFHEKQVEKKPTKKSFDNFADFGRQNSPPKNTTARDPQSPQTPTLQQLNLPDAPKEIHQINQQTIHHIHASSLKQIQILATTIIPQLQALSDQNQKSTNVLNEVNQFMNGIEQGQAMVIQKIAEIKSSQDDLNHRLNMTCIRMRDVIQKQSQIIKDLKGTIDGEVEMNVERVGVLETYAENVENQLAQNKMYPRRGSKQFNHNEGNQQIYQASGSENSQPSSIYNKKSMQSMREMSMSMSVANRNSKGHSQIGSQHNKNEYESNESSGAVPEGGIYRQKLFQQLRNQKYNHDENSEQDDDEEDRNQKPETRVSIEQNQHNQQFFLKKTEEKQIEYPPRKESSDDGYEHKNDQALNQQQVHQQNYQQNQNYQEQQKNVNDQQQKQQNQEEQAAKRLYLKRVSTIQMVNFLTPIKQEQYAVVVQKIQAKTENQLDIIYSNLYEKYKEKMAQLEAMKSQQASPPSVPAQNGLPTYDEFSSNNFKNLNMPQKNNNDDFFG